MKGTVENIGPEDVHIEEAQLTAKNTIKLIFNRKMESVIESDIELISSTTPSAISFSSCKSNTINPDG